MKKKILALMLTTAMVIGSLTGCGSKKEETPADTTKTETSAKEEKTETVQADQTATKKFKILSIWAEDTKEGKMLNDLTKRYVEEVNPNFEYEFELVSANDLSTKIATLMASNDLPDAFAYVAGAPLKDLIEADKVVNISEALKTTGGLDQIEEGAASILRNLSDSEDLYDLPLGLNMEGFWYNKAVFEKAGAAVPSTWDELLAACEILKAKGIQPLSAGGADKWPLSRLVNAYIIRTMGVDAVKEATNGERSFTEEGFVNAAQMIFDMAEKGYFGEGVTTVDQTTAGNMLLAGESAMYYTGSWFTEDIVSENNPAGEDGIGFFSIPVVDEAISTATEYPMNCGNILCLSKANYDEATAGWLKYFVENAGDYAMEEMGAVKGYKYDVASKLTPVNQLVADTLASVTKAGTWFEATMNNETKSAAQDNVQTLINGDMTAQEYMESIQDAYELSK